MGLCLVTGGAGFIGRWLVSELLQRRKRVIVLDNLSGCRANLAEFSGRPGFEGLIRGDIRNTGTLYEFFFRGLERCYHLAAGIDESKSLEEPQETDCVVGDTMRLLERCRGYDTKMVFASTSRVYSGSRPAIAPGEPSRMVGDGSRAAALTGWKAKVDLCEGIGRTRAWMESAATEERETE